MALAQDQIPEAATNPQLLLLSPLDNVLVVRAVIQPGEEILIEGEPVIISDQIGLGHKLARMAIAKGAKIVKYGAPIGSATKNISTGEHVHLSNLKSDYTATYALNESDEMPLPGEQTP